MEAERLPDADVKLLPAPTEPLRILVVDDSRAQTMMLAAMLRKFGHEVDVAYDGTEALLLWEWYPHDIVLSDWSMPGLTGPDLCSRIRNSKTPYYTYFILLTSKSGAEEIAAGLDAGADDFLTKPVSSQELRARVRAGQRLLDKERELVRRNAQLSDALEEIQKLYEALDNDLVDARRLQQSLVRDREAHFDGADVALYLRPSGHVGGDLVGHYPIGTTGVGLFSIDVSGHGIASALLTARLAGFFAGPVPPQNIGLTRDATGDIIARDPAEVVTELNRIMMDELRAEQYLTMYLAHICLETGYVKFVQAGHPNALVMRDNGYVGEVDSSGLPVGLFDAADYKTEEFYLLPGERLIIATDGFSEAEDINGVMLGQHGLRLMLKRRSDLKGQAMLESLVWDLTEWSGEREFQDDLSVVLFEYSGAESGNVALKD
ncbi:MAG: SpoIIE family protein phosphatase [Deltaproteobacteria bacterium]